MYEKKVECVLLPKAMAKKNVTSDENRIFPLGVKFDISVCDYIFSTESEFGCEEWNSSARSGFVAGTIGIYLFVFQ